MGLGTQGLRPTGHCAIRAGHGQGAEGPTPSSAGEEEPTHTQLWGPDPLLLLEASCSTPGNGAQHAEAAGAERGQGLWGQMGLGQKPTKQPLAA